eukprot:TRINITY_DN16056_c0_g1_i1.p1 TRINITY_DN16056_c0_g1~~TRINITY_DN16056_c0_g1_i1.p1  ORF type:complete len:194 (-),score=50.16 TRINITY_DN16056_c0_g1_i1:43-603(-)
MATESHPDVESVLFSSQEIATRVKELGAIISEEYQGKELVLVCILKGAYVFMADLSRAITIPHHIEFMSCSSYGHSTTSSGVVKINLDLGSSVEGKHVLIVEDIIDTGLTLSYLLNNLKSRQAASVEVAVFLTKKGTQTTSLPKPVKHSAFTVDPHFVVGYGLDYNQTYRNLPFLGILKKSVYSGH